MQKTRNLINMVIKMYTRLTRHQTGAGAGADRRCLSLRESRAWLEMKSIYA